MSAPDYRRLAGKLVEHSSHLEDLTLEVRGVGRQPLAPELLDELAVTIDELLLTLDEHRHACGPDDLLDSAVAEARALMRGVRAQALGREQIAEAASGVTRRLESVIRQDKLAA